MAYGVVNMKNAIQMSGCLIHLHPPVVVPACSIIYRKHESVKKQAYEARIQKVEHSFFTPLVFAALEKWAMKLLHFIRD